MAKRNKSVIEELIDEIENSAEVDEIALFLTTVVKEISPYVNEASTYELFYDALSNGIRVEDAKMLGAAIKATALETPEQKIH